MPNDASPMARDVRLIREAIVDGGSGGSGGTMVYLIPDGTPESAFTYNTLKSLLDDGHSIALLTIDEEYRDIKYLTSLALNSTTSKYEATFIGCGAITKMFEINVFVASSRDDIMEYD